MTELSKYGANTYSHRFGSWNEALKRAGLEPDVGGTEITDVDLLNEIKRLKNELGHTPSVDEMDDRGKYGTTTYGNRFGSWSGALEKAGLEPPQKRIPESDLLTELQSLNQELDHVPRREDMNEIGEYSSGIYYNRFGNWTSALEEAGITPGLHRDITQDDLIEEIRLIAEELGRAPLRQEVAEFGRYSESTYWRYFDSWEDVVGQAGYDPIIELDVSEADLISDLQKFAEELGHTPTREEMNQEGPYSGSTYSRRFDGWNAALEAANLGLNSSHGVSDQALLDELHRLQSLSKKRKYCRKISLIGPITVSKSVKFVKNHFFGQAQGSF